MHPICCSKYRVVSCHNWQYRNPGNPEAPKNIIPASSKIPSELERSVNTMSDAAVENHHPPGTPIVTPAQPPLNDNNNAAAAGDNAQASDPDQEQVQELESELSKLKVRACRIITSI